MYLVSDASKLSEKCEWCDKNKQWYTAGKDGVVVGVHQPLLSVLK